MAKSRARKFADMMDSSDNIKSDRLTNAVPADGSITAAKLAAGAVTTAKLAADAVTTAKIADGAVPDAIAAGTIAAFGMNSAPSGWLKCNGQLVSRTTYADLFAQIGTTYGTTTSSNFKLPDLRGEFLRGHDDGRGIDSNRTIGSYQGEGMPRLYGGFRDHHGSSRMNVKNISGHTNPFVESGTSSWRTRIESSSGSAADIILDSNRVISAANDLRPRNRALLFCIKT